MSTSTSKSTARRSGKGGARSGVASPSKSSPRKGASTSRPLHAGMNLMVSGMTEEAPAPWSELVALLRQQCDFNAELARHMNTLVHATHAPGSVIGAAAHPSLRDVASALKSETLPLPDESHLASVMRSALELLAYSKPFGALDIHEIIMGGMPSAALARLASSSTILGAEKVAQAVGVSTRTLKRRKDEHLSRDQGSRAWRFAELLAKAAEVFGTRDAAERWMDEPSRALNGRKPLELMMTSAGAEVVDDYLTRLEYGVYT